MIFTDIRKEHFEQYQNLIDSNFTFEYFIWFLQNVLCEKHNIVVIIENDNIIGAGTYFIEDKLTHNCCRMGHIENIFISPHYRGKGYGESLVKYLLEKCDQLKCYRVDLNCSNELEMFYKKNGFKTNNICMNVYFENNFTK